MSSFLWLLLYLAPLLGLTAAVFGWLGWRWRGSDLQQRIQELGTQLAEAQTTLHAAEAAHSTALSRDEASAAESARLEKELHPLRDELQTAKAAAQQRQDEAGKASAAIHSLEAEAMRLTAELERARAAHATALTELTATQADLTATRAELAAAQAEIASLRSASAPPVSAVEAAPAIPAAEAPPAKPKRKRSTTPAAKPKAPAAASLREKIAALEPLLAKEQAGISTLTQERDDWQRRIATLEANSPPNPAGLALARRSLADSEKRLATATAEIERLQNQTRALRRVEENAASFAEMPEDDLTQIKGIKKVIGEQLRSHGVRTWRQIALWDEGELRAFSELLAFKNRATREKWQEQARALHEAAYGTLF